MVPVITSEIAEKILGCKEDPVNVSLDLRISENRVYIVGGTADICGNKIPLAKLENLKEKMCYAIEDGEVKPIALFSGETNLYYKLLPTKDWPTITLSSTPMHRFTFISPRKDTETKIREISPVFGKVLDTCCGLGYTAIMSAKHASEVHTFERDGNIQTIAKYNPYSQELFENKKIKIHLEDVQEGIKKFQDSCFDRVIHDPPTFKYSPELYSAEFHRELYRVTKKNGILYHYCPSPQRTKGRRMFPRIARQLKEAGFRNVIFHEFSSGIRAVK